MVRWPSLFILTRAEWPTTEIGDLPETNLEVKVEKAIFTLQSIEIVLNRMHEFLVKYSSWLVLAKGSLAVRIQVRSKER